MFFSSVVRMFKRGNVAVCGLRGRGKDLLMSNVVVRRHKPYVSNVDYGGKYIPFSYSDFDVKNTYKNFLSGDINKYEFPFPDGTDLYLSDSGVYFPAQYCNELNKLYPSFPVFCALSRHVGLSNVHYNVQALPRVWDKMREQVDQYINCRGCFVLFGKIVFQKIRIYEQYDACVSNVPPLRLSLHLKESTTDQVLKASYLASHGEIKTRYLIYINRSKYDSRRFKTMLSSGR